MKTMTINQGNEIMSITVGRLMRHASASDIEGGLQSATGGRGQTGGYYLNLRVTASVARVSTPVNRATEKAKWALGSDQTRNIRTAPVIPPRSQLPVKNRRRRVRPGESWGVPGLPGGTLCCTRTPHIYGGDPGQVLHAGAKWRRVRAPVALRGLRTENRGCDFDHFTVGAGTRFVKPIDRTRNSC